MVAEVDVLQSAQDQQEKHPTCNRQITPGPSSFSKATQATNPVKISTARHPALSTSGSRPESSMQRIVTALLPSPSGPSTAYPHAVSSLSMKSS